jgi:hypothetical protein
MLNLEPATLMSSPTPHSVVGYIFMYYLHKQWTCATEILNHWLCLHVTFTQTMDLWNWDLDSSRGSSSCRHPYLAVLLAMSSCNICTNNGVVQLWSWILSQLLSSRHPYLAVLSAMSSCNIYANNWLVELRSWILSQLLSCLHPYLAVLLAMSSCNIHTNNGLVQLRSWILSQLLSCRCSVVGYVFM